MWVYGSGFPKSLDVSKAIDKRGGNSHLTAEIGAALKAARKSRGITATEADRTYCGGVTLWSWYEGRPAGQQMPTADVMDRVADDWPELRPYADLIAEAEREVIGKMENPASSIYSQSENEMSRNVPITAPATPEAKQWQGWGTALKPAFEPIIVARKPLTGTVAENVLQWGTGGINIDGCRVGTTKRVPSSVSRTDGQIYNGGWGQEDGSESGHNPNIGRFPANLIHDGSKQVVGLFPANANPDKRTIKFAKNGRGSSGIYGDFGSTLINGRAYGDTGSAARFFYCAKASKSERGEGNIHPTVKPLALMKYLITLGLPPGGTVLDPFCGSGTTALACKELGRNYICIEKELEYYRIACNRLDQPIELIPDEPIEEIIDNSPLQLKLF
jgi:site-specific DNA-methyltransferase (adenine-specific)